MSQRIALALLLSLVLLCAACSHQANITTKQGFMMGRIVRSDARAIYIERSAYQPLIAIKRKDIIEIDHPGDGVAAIGAVLVGLHAIPLAMGAMILSDAGDSNVANLFGGLIFASGIPGTVVGSGMLIWSYHAWSGSVDAAEARDDGPSVSFGPTMLPDARGNPRAGLGVGFTY